MTKLLDAIRFHLCITNFGALPAPLWFLIASPLLRFAIGGKSWFHWPCNVSRSPLKPDFWCVNLSHR